MKSQEYSYRKMYKNIFNQNASHHRKGFQPLLQIYRQHLQLIQAHNTKQTYKN